MSKLRALWLGKLPLGEAFWTWTVGVGVLVNLSTTVLFFTLTTLDRSWPELLAAYFLSLPYNVVAGVGVWRSAACYQGGAVYANLARIASVVVVVLLSLA